MAEQKTPEGGSGQTAEDKEQIAANKAAETGTRETRGAATPGASAPDSTAIRAAFTPGSDPISDAQGNAVDDDGSTAEDREKARARRRGVAEEELEDLAANTIWVVSNRIDDRVVPGSWERDPRHPGGESILGGDTPQRVYRTTTIERLIMGGELVETDPPMATVQVTDETGKKVTVRNRYMPVEVMIEPATSWAAQPGHPTPIGRKLNRNLFHPETVAKVSARQRQLPASLSVPPGGYVPRHQDVDRPQ